MVLIPGTVRPSQGTTFPTSELQYGAGTVSVSVSARYVVGDFQSQYGSRNGWCCHSRTTILKYHSIGSYPCDIDMCVAVAAVGARRFPGHKHGML